MTGLPRRDAAERAAASPSAARPGPGGAARARWGRALGNPWVMTAAAGLAGYWLGRRRRARARRLPPAVARLARELAVVALTAAVRGYLARRASPA